MSNNVDRRPGLIKDGGSIGYEGNLTRVFITRVAEATPGTENTRDITFEKDVRYTLEFTYPNGESPEPYRTTSLSSVKERINEELKHYDTNSLERFMKSINWQQLS